MQKTFLYLIISRAIIYIKTGLLRFLTNLIKRLIEVKRLGQTLEEITNQQLGVESYYADNFRSTVF